MCFEGQVVTNPITIICYACSIMSYWAGLFLEDDKEALIAASNTMLKIAMKLLDKKAMRKNQHLLTDDQKDSQEEGKN